MRKRTDRMDERIRRAGEKKKSRQRKKLGDEIGEHARDRSNRMDRRATGETGQTRRIVERGRGVENRRIEHKIGTVWIRKEVSATGKEKGWAASIQQREARDCE